MKLFDSSKEDKKPTIEITKTSEESKEKPNDKSMSSAVSMIKNAVGALGSPFISLSPKSNMEKLVSMGFANRAQNERLLKKYNNNFEKVIEHLIENQDSNFVH